MEAAGFWALARQQPAKAALVDAFGATTSFGELLERVNRLSNLLRSIGVRAGDHAAFMVPNGPDVFELVLAFGQVGVLYTPINHHLLPDEVAWLLEDSAARIFVADQRFAATAAAAARSAATPAEGCFSIGPMHGFQSLELACRAQPPSVPEDRSPGGAMVYTSGTTGRPKGILRPPSADFEAHVRTARAGADKYGWDADVVYLVQGPLYHSGVLSHPTNVLHIGGTVVIMDDAWRAEDCLALIDEHRVNGTHMVPTMFHRLLALPREVRESYDVSSLQSNGTVQSGAACAPDVKRRMLDWWGPAFLEVYGGSEGSFTKITSQDWLEHPGSVGRANPGLLVTILDDDGRELPVGEVGLVYARADGQEGLGSHYHNDPEKTADSRRNGFQTLGDLGYLDADGWLYIVDRRVDLIVSGGVNIYPAEVEAVLLQHPSVADVAVIGVPNVEWGQEVRAVVQLLRIEDAGDELANELIEHARAALAKYKCPRSIEFRSALPRSESGKLYKRRLREEHVAS
jgi:long-chain acyl-CoA synthetase